jgi:Na+-translocating ferredoxin:NAD+ oxidoreductase subunit B
MAGLITLSLLALLLGALLGWAAHRYRVESDPVVERINELLPQTQCGQCNYPGCRPYAEAIARGEAEINQCPPGGEAGIRALAELLGREPLPLDAERGVEQPPRVAFILEELCIGCVKCIQACPVDAIVGAPKRMHTVVAELCTGCDLCVAPCPVDCIEMRPMQEPRLPWRGVPLQLRD